MSILKNLNTAKTPLSPANWKSNSASKFPVTDMTKIDWTELCLDGQNLYTLMIQAINSCINATRDAEGVAVFSYNDIYERMGIDNVIATFNAFMDDKDTTLEYYDKFILSEDEDGYNWRRYLTERALGAFANDWNIDITPSDPVKPELVDGLLDIMKAFDFLKKIPAEFDNEDEIVLLYDLYRRMKNLDPESIRHDFGIFLGESNLGESIVVMTPREKDDENQNPNPEADENQNPNPEAGCPCRERKMNDAKADATEERIRNMVLQFLKSLSN